MIKELWGKLNAEIPKGLFIFDLDVGVGVSSKLKKDVGVDPAVIDKGIEECKKAVE